MGLVVVKIVENKKNGEVHQEMQNLFDEFPKFQRGYNVVMVVADRFSKITHFLAWVKSRRVVNFVIIHLCKARIPVSRQLGLFKVLHNWDSK